MAVEMGYVVKEIHEIWHYERTERYNPVTQQGGLFTSYKFIFESKTRGLRMA